MRDVTISGSEWQNACGCDGDHSATDHHRLYGGRVYVTGLALLVTALRITNREDADGGQREFHPMDADEYEALESLDLISFATTDIEGFSGDWIIFMIPGEM
jgi:hypothetical protein